MTISDWGMSPNVALAFDEILSRPKGLILICGPTASGKTGTAEMFSARLSARCSRVNLDDGDTVGVPISDPTAFVFAGDLRNGDTIRRACELSRQAIVVAVLRSGRSIGALGRFVDLGVTTELICESNPVIITQQLCDALCPKCRHSVRASPDLMAELALSMADLSLTSGVVYEAGTCDSCAGGYSGKVPIFEVVVARPTWRVGIEDGYKIVVTMKQDGLVKLVSGRITLGEFRKRILVSQR